MFLSVKLNRSSPIVRRNCVIGAVESSSFVNSRNGMLRSFIRWNGKSHIRYFCHIMSVGCSRFISFSVNLSGTQRRRLRQLAD